MQSRPKRDNNIAFPLLFREKEIGSASALHSATYAKTCVRIGSTHTLAIREFMDKLHPKLGN